MLAFMMASMMVAASDPAPRQATSLKNEPTRYCRELGSASSRSEAIRICRTRAQWLKWDGCHGATRYCPPKKRVALTSGLPGRETAFPLNEDSRIICRKLSVTGSRLKAISTCLPQREWQRMYDNTQTEIKELQNTFSKKGPF